MDFKPIVTVALLLLVLVSVAAVAVAFSIDFTWNYYKNKLSSAFSSVAAYAVENPVSKGITNVSATAVKFVDKKVDNVQKHLNTGITKVVDTNCRVLKTLGGVANPLNPFKGQLEAELNKLTLEYRNSGKRAVYKITTAAEELPLERSFNSTQKLYIVIHGFTSVPGVYDTISKALSKGNSHVVALDGSSLSRSLRSNAQVRFIGERLCAVLAALVHNGASPEAIHIIGHSLGAHIAGFTGKTFQSLTGSKVARITGLDPSGVCFGRVDPELRLNKEDAEFVDVVHSNAGIFGLKDPVGHVEFYPNGGEQQPKCRLSVKCSHNRALLYFAEALTRPDAFPARKCRDWEAFKQQECDESVSSMGPLCQPGVTGSYFFQTDGSSPFGLGEAGTRWQNNDEGFIRNIANPFNKYIPGFKKK